MHNLLKLKKLDFTKVEELEGEASLHLKISICSIYILIILCHSIITTSSLSINVIFMLNRNLNDEISAIQRISSPSKMDSQTQRQKKGKENDIFVENRENNLIYSIWKLNFFGFIGLQLNEIATFTPI